ncbi:MAG TPA: hypothetical protein VEK79_25285 [Thermoanaerobaculia bacterium]|nr:hypothetical protein [Thermoanaerobaculia bacterium]
MNLRPIAVMLLCLALRVSAATLETPKPNEKWITVTADEFQFISNASPAKTLDIARDMLRMRAAIGQITNLKIRSTLPTKVFLFTGERRFGAYRDALLQRKAENVGGLFAHADTGNFIVMRTDDEVDRIVYHELTHYLVQNTIAGLPLWFNEGLAEYYSTFRTDGKSMQIGRPVAEHVLWLRSEPLIPLRELLATTKESPIYNEGERIGVFYAQSWALLHYLLVDPERRSRLGQFLSHLGSGKSVDEAFTAAFAMKYAQLEQELRGYVRRSVFSYLNIPIAEATMVELRAPEPMSRDALLFQFGHLLAQTGRANSSTAERFLNESLDANPTNAAAHADLGRLHEAWGRRAEADAAYAAAVKLGSEDPEVFLQAASSLMERHAGRSATSVPRAEIMKMRELFERATELDPTRAIGWAGLGATYVGQTEDLDAGIAALEKALALTPGDEQSAFHLAQLYANAGRAADAVKLVQRLERSTTLDADKKTYLRSIAEHFDRAAAHEKIVASMNDAIDQANAGHYAEALTIVDAVLPSIVDPETREQAQKFRDEVAAKIRKR